MRAGTTAAPTSRRRRSAQRSSGGALVRSYRTSDEGCLTARECFIFAGASTCRSSSTAFASNWAKSREHVRHLPDVAAVAVVAEQRDGRVAHLVAYVVPAGPLAQTPFRAGLALKEQLRRTLPHYMIPKRSRFARRCP